MKKFTNFTARSIWLLLHGNRIMSKNNGKIYYVVARGREVGIYDTWKECKNQTDGIANAKFRKFFNLEEAEEFLNFWKNYSSPIKESSESLSPIESSENPGKICKDSENSEKDQSGGVNPSSTSGVNAAHMTNQQWHQFETQSAAQVSQIFCPPHSPYSVSSEGRTEHKNVDVLALSLRLDSFEKRFDACLKEVGAIASEISNIKTEIKGIKETLSSRTQSNQSSVCGNFTQKPSDRMFQTTLSFNNGTSNQSRSYSTQHNSDNSEKINLKKEVKLKRKLSRSDSLENPKRFANDEEASSDFLSKIKTEGIDYTSFIVDDDYVEVYTDGATHGNGKDDAKAGIGIWWGHNHPLNIGEPLVGPPTNNNAEIQAARVAIELALKCGLKKLKIFTDSEFLINCATRWIYRWKKNGWRLVNGGPVKNRKELEKLDKVAAKISVRWEKVIAHVGIVGNEMADRLANEGAAKYKSS